MAPPDRVTWILGVGVFLGGAPALAHVPHDTARALAAPADLDPSVPWLLLLDPQEADLLLRSDDAGASWRMIGGAPLVDDLVGAAAVGGQSVFLGADAVWSTDDGGESWASEDLPADVSLVRSMEGGYRLAGRGGVWEGAPGAWTRVLDEAVGALGPGPSALGLDGSVWTAEAGAWASVAGPVEQPLSVAAADGALWVGDADGMVWRRESDTWTACGELGARDWAQVTLLEWDGARLLASTAGHGPYLSDDRCETWTDRATGEDPDFDADGGATGISDSWVFLQANGDQWVFGGWSGISATADAGATWTQPPLIPVDYTRGLWASSGSDRIWVGPYAAGPGWTDDGGARFVAPSLGLVNGNVQAVLQHPAGVAADTVYALVNHRPYVSTDQGSSWTLLHPDAPQIQSLTAWEDPGHVWLLAEREGTGVVWQTLDGGASWATLDALGTPASGGAPAYAVGLADGTRCLVHHGPVGVACTADGMSAATEFLVGTGVFVAPPVVWPYAAPDRLVLGTEAGVHVVDEQGEISTSEALGGDSCVRLLVTDDDTLFCASRTGGLWRSEDGGSSWTDTAVTFPAWVHVMESRPHFAARGELLVGTHDGCFVVHDAGGERPWSERWAPWQRIDDVSSLLTWTGETTTLEDVEAGFGQVSVLSAHAAAQGWLRGTEIAVYGGLSDGGTATLWVDGVEGPSFVDGAVPTASVEGLDDGWHDVRVVAGAAGGAWLDALEARGDGAVLDLETPDTGLDTDADTDAADSSAEGRPPVSQGCGCGRGGAALVVLPLLVTRRRRSRG